MKKVKRLLSMLTTLCLMASTFTAVSVKADETTGWIPVAATSFGIANGAKTDQWNKGTISVGDNMKIAKAHHRIDVLPKLGYLKFTSASTKFNITDFSPRTNYVSIVPADTTISQSVFGMTGAQIYAEKPTFRISFDLQAVSTEYNGKSDISFAFDKAVGAGSDDFKNAYNEKKVIQNVYQTNTKESWSADGYERVSFEVSPDTTNYINFMIYFSCPDVVAEADATEENPVNTGNVAYYFDNLLIEKKVNYDTSDKVTMMRLDNSDYAMMYNSDPANANAAAILAKYDENNNLLSAAVEKVNTEIKYPALATDNVKTFLWSDFETLTPAGNTTAYEEKGMKLAKTVHFTNANFSESWDAGINPLVTTTTTTEEVVDEATGETTTKEVVTETITALESSAVSKGYCMNAKGAVLEKHLSKRMNETGKFGFSLVQLGLREAKANGKTKGVIKVRIAVADSGENHPETMPVKLYMGIVDYAAGFTESESAVFQKTYNLPLHGPETTTTNLHYINSANLEYQDLYLPFDLSQLAGNYGRSLVVECDGTNAAGYASFAVPYVWVYYAD